MYFHGVLVSCEVDTTYGAKFEGGECHRIVNEVPQLILFNPSILSK
jgi:hypothetical protein